MSTAPRLLAIDTVTESCSAALLMDDVLTQRIENSRAHSRLILSMVDSLLAERNIELSALTAIAVDVGPGSFTGVRLGIGVAQGLGYAAQLKVIAVGSLEALAQSVVVEVAQSTKLTGDGDSNSDGDDNADSDGDSNSNSDKVAHDGKKTYSVLPAIDARMHQIYYAHYQVDVAQPPRELIAPSLIAPRELPRELVLPGAATAVGGGWAAYQNELPTPAMHIVNRNPQAEIVARIAAQRIDAAVSPLAVRASYVRNQVATPSVKALGNASMNVSG